MIKITIESGAQVVMTEKPIINVFGNYYHYSQDNDAHAYGKGPVEESQFTESDTTIPIDCSNAIQKVFVHQFKFRDTIFNSEQQIKKATTLIDLSSNTELAMLMTVGQEINAVRASASCMDFVRALIGLEVIPFTDLRTIQLKANAMTRKRNGYRKSGKKYAPLPGSHLHWSSRDRLIGDKLYEAMTKL